MATQNRLDENGLLYLLTALWNKFGAQNGFSGDYNDLQNRPDLRGFQTAEQVIAAISAALALAGYQSAAQVRAAIEDAVSKIDTEIYVVVQDELPDPAQGNMNKIYVLIPDKTEWRTDGTEWDSIGILGVDLTGYFNELNLQPIANAQIAAMIEALEG